MPPTDKRCLQCGALPSAIMGICRRDGCPHFAPSAVAATDVQQGEFRHSYDHDLSKAFAPASSERAQLAPPTKAEISAYRDLFRSELDKRMDPKHPSASPSTEAHEIALRNFVNTRNAAPSANRSTIIRECCAALDMLYERGPSRGELAWRQAWGSGVLDAAELLGNLDQPEGRDA